MSEIGPSHATADSTSVASLRVDQHPSCLSHCMARNKIPGPWGFAAGNLASHSLLFFSLIPTKLPWYIVPILPALALAIALLFRAACAHALGSQRACFWVHLFLSLAVECKSVEARGISFARCQRRSVSRCRCHPSSGANRHLSPKRRRRNNFYLRPPLLLHIRPSVRVYANRSMVRLLNPDQLREWAKQGGRFLWTEKSLDDQIHPSFELIAAAGKQQYFRDGSK